MRHAADNVSGLLYRYRRGAEKAVVQQAEHIALCLLLLVLILFYNEVSQLFELLNERQQHERCNEIEYGVHYRYRLFVYHACHEREIKDSVEYIEYREEKNRADNVEAKVHGGYALGVFACAY